MADRGHELTDELLRELEERIAEEYSEAVREAEKKLKKYMEAFDKEDEIQKERLAAGEITKAEYDEWAVRQMMYSQHWEAMRDTLAEDMHHANEIALGIARDAMPDVYAINANYALYEIEHGAGIDTGMTLYNHDTAAYLISQERKLMPGPSTAKQKLIAANKDLQWNKQKIQSAVLQGVLLGESSSGIAKRLMSVGQMDYNAAVRYARTMTTNAQNKGRYDSYRRAKEKGVDLTIEWRATLDGRTRHEHRWMHGQRTEVDKPFITPDGFEIMWPAQSDGPGASDIPQQMIWNCRCTLRAMVKGFERDTVTESAWMRDQGLSFEEWQNQGSGRRNEFTSTKNPSIIKLPDIRIPHGVGAKRRGEGILDFDTGERFDLVEGSRLQNVTVFAGKGTNTPYKSAAKYAERYGGKEEDWQHAKGIGLVDTSDGHRKANIHWSQCEGIGRVEMFIKEWLE